MAQVARASHAVHRKAPARHINRIPPPRSHRLRVLFIQQSKNSHGNYKEISRCKGRSGHSRRQKDGTCGKESRTGCAKGGTRREESSTGCTEDCASRQEGCTCHPKSGRNQSSCCSTRTRSAQAHQNGTQQDHADCPLGAAVWRRAQGRPRSACRAGDRDFGFDPQKRIRRIHAARRHQNWPATSACQEKTLWQRPVYWRRALVPRQARVGQDQDPCAQEAQRRDSLTGPIDPNRLWRYRSPQCDSIRLHSLHR